MERFTEMVLTAPKPRLSRGGNVRGVLVKVTVSLDGYRESDAVNQCAFPIGHGGHGDRHNDARVLSSQDSQG